MAVQAEQPDGTLLAMEHDERDRVRARRPHPERRLDSSREVTKRRPLHEPQHLYELTRPSRAEVGFEAPAQKREATGQLQCLERAREVQRPGLSLQEGQVVPWVIGGVLAPPLAGVGGDELCPEEIEICSMPPDTITS